MKLVLEGGTDVAVVSLFDIDALPPRVAGPAEMKTMQENEAILCMPTGADGGYLLHAYVDEPIPERILKYCPADTLACRLWIKNGRLGFGGTESAHASFKPNTAIRSDGIIAAGRYHVTAYRTDYPEGFVEDAVDAALGPGRAKLLRVEGHIVISAILMMIAALFVSGWRAALGVAGVGIIVHHIFGRMVGLRDVRAQKKTVELDFPSIVVEMKALTGKSPGE